MALAIVDLRGSLPTNGAYLTRRNPPTTIVVHHSASPASTSIRTIAEYHVCTRGYPGIAYHYVVAPDGFVAQTNDDSAVSWHAGCAAAHGSDCPDNANTYSLGICLNGDFTDAPPPQAQIEATRALIAHLRGKYGEMWVLGHKEAHGCQYTACPGATWTTWKDALQEQHMTKLAGHVQIWSDATRDHLRRALYPALKVLVGVDPIVIRDQLLPYYQTKPFIWPRKWTDDIAVNCVARGAAGAKQWRDAVIGDYAHWRTVLGCDTVELDNEIICQTDDEAKRHNEFEAEVIRLLAQDGFGSIALNASVGWPKIEHWQWYKETLQGAQYIGLHEYGWPATNQEGQDLRYFPWHVLRYRKACEEIRRLGYRLPRILITELGWEGALVNIGHRGFRMFSDQTPYLDWLKWYDGQLQGDPRVEYASIFETGAKSDWQEMDAVLSRIDAGLENYVRSSAPAPSQPIDAEVTQLKAMLAIQPATQKACIERGYTYLREAYNVGDAHARALAYDPVRKKYLGLWLDSRTWKVTREEALSGPMTL